MNKDLDEDILIDIYSCIYYIRRLYARLFKKIPLINFDGYSFNMIYPEIWITSYSEAATFNKLLYKSVDKFPDAAFYLADFYINEIGKIQEDKAANTFWLAGYMERVIEDERLTCYPLAEISEERVLALEAAIKEQLEEESTDE